MLLSCNPGFWEYEWGLLRVDENFNLLNMLKTEVGMWLLIDIVSLYY